MRIGGERGRGVRAEGAHVDTLANGLEQTSARTRHIARSSARLEGRLKAVLQDVWLLRRFFAGGAGVGVLPSALPGAQRRSIAARIDSTSAPDA